MAEILIISIIILITIPTAVCVLWRRLNSRDREIEAARDTIYQSLEDMESKLHELHNNLKTTDPDLENEPVQPEGFSFLRDLIAPALRELGCKVTYNDQDGVILFKYQGYSFFNRGPETSPMQRLILPGILDVDCDDPNLPKVIEAVNHISLNWGPKVRWDILEDDDKDRTVYRFAVLQDYTIHHNIPNPTKYIETLLENFFVCLNEMRNMLTGIQAGKEASRGGNWDASSMGMCNEQLN